MILFSSLKTSAQEDSLGGWTVASIHYFLSPKFALYGEAQVRSQRLVNDFFYYELKGGVTYFLPKKNLVFFGLGSYKTYTSPGNFKEPVVSDEFRMWEQLVLNNNINRLKIEHRYRIEQRWVNGVYSNRFRYRLNPIIRLISLQSLIKTIYISVYDEVFFTNKQPYFLRNRFFAGAGYRFTKLFTGQLGFLRQFDYKGTDEGSGKNFIQASFYI
jgi:hypothetical protein